MSPSKILAILIILGSSSLALAAPASAPADHERMWTILASQNNASKGNLDNKPVQTDPGVLVTSQRDPHGKK